MAISRTRTTLVSTLALAVIALAPVGLTGPADAAAPAKTYANCDAMHRDYPHGVGKPGARDKTSGTPVRTFKVSKALYAANKGSDRDKDGIACEAV